MILITKNKIIDIEVVKKQVRDYTKNSKDFVEYYLEFNYNKICLNYNSEDERDTVYNKICRAYLEGIEILDLRI